MDLRLFPLNTVLFPGMALPLQVFEPRYLRLVAECVDASEPFGVALIREGVEVGGPAVPHAMGTTARIRSYSAGADGRLHLDTLGERRFRILALHDDRPYLRAEVEYPIDELTVVPPDLLDRARDDYSLVRRLQLTARGEYQRQPAVPRDPGSLADAIGALGPAPPSVLQRLLETLDVRRRLEDALALLEAALPPVHRQAAAAVAARWGRLDRTN